MVKTYLEIIGHEYKDLLRTFKKPKKTDKTKSRQWELENGIKRVNKMWKHCVWIPKLQYVVLINKGKMALLNRLSLLSIVHNLWRTYDPCPDVSTTLE